MKDAERIGGSADVSYFSKIQRGCPVGSLPRPHLWNVLTHCRRVRSRDWQIASRKMRKRSTQTLCLCLTHLHWIRDTLCLIMSLSHRQTHTFPLKINIVKSLRFYNSVLALIIKHCIVCCTFLFSFPIIQVVWTQLTVQSEGFLCNINSSVVD